MKIVIAMDSFKGGVAAADACRAVAAGLRDVDANLDLVLKPMADGGEGTAAALLAARPSGQWIPVTVPGPLPERQVCAGYAWFGDDCTAVVEMAAANGLPLLADRERNPMKTSTYGTGQLVRAAAAKGARHILLAIGGSATVDGGVGAAAALGWRFLAENGQPVPHGGGYLHEITRIIPPDDDTLPQITVLCDVTNPLLGTMGAAAVFGPQKGATPEMVVRLETGLAHLAETVANQLGFDMKLLAGGGAAGGLGSGAAAFMRARLAPGIAAIIDAAGLAAALQSADRCITGEGSFDSQSLQGKVVSGVARAAQAAGVPTAVFAGSVKTGSAECRSIGIDTVMATHDPDMPFAEVLRHEKDLLRKTAARWLRQHNKPEETR